MQDNHHKVDIMGRKQKYISFLVKTMMGMIIITAWDPALSNYSSLLNWGEFWSTLPCSYLLKIQIYYVTYVQVFALSFVTT